MNLYIKNKNNDAKVDAFMKMKRKDTEGKSK